MTEAGTDKEEGKDLDDGTGFIIGPHDEEEKEKEPPAKKPFSFLDMSDEELEEELRKANKNTYWEFGLYIEKKRRAGKEEVFVYEKDGDRLPVLPTYTDKMSKEVCGEPVAVSFGNLPPSTNVNSKGNPNSIRFSTHLEIHFDITEGAETKEGKSIAYKKAQSFLAAAYRGDTLGGKPVRRFRLTNMSEEELKAWGEVRAAFEGQGKKIEFILTDEQQKVFDRYAAEFDEIIKLNRELVSGVKEEEKTVDVSKTETKEPASEADKSVTEEPVVEKTPEKLTAEEPITEEIAPETVELEVDSIMDTTDPMSEEEKAARLDAIVEAFEKGEYKADEPSTETTSLAERKPAEIDLIADDKGYNAWLEILTSDDFVFDEASEEFANEEKSNAAANDAIPVGPVTEENNGTWTDAAPFFKRMGREEAASMKKDAWSDVSPFFKNMDEVEATSAKENAIKAFFENMDEVESTAAKENAIKAFFKAMDEIAQESSNSGVSSVVKEEAAEEEKLYDLSTYQGRVDARDAVISRIRTNLKTAYTKRAEKVWAIVKNEAKEDLAKYADRHCEKTEEVISKSEGLRTAKDILEEVKRRVGESRFANKRAMDAYNRKRNKEGIEQCLRYWEQGKKHEGR